MRRLLALLLLAPVYAMAGAIGHCVFTSQYCNYGATETAVGNLLTIRFWGDTDRNGEFTLSETALLDLSGAPGGFFHPGRIDITFFAVASGGAQSVGSFGSFYCRAYSLTTDPDRGGYTVGNMCNHGIYPIYLQSAVPIDMNIQGNSGWFYLQVAFYSEDIQTGQISPVAVSLSPEPSPVWLCGAGLVAAGICRRWSLNRARSRG